MNSRIIQCLNNENGNYMLPFLWLHGEAQEEIQKEILAIKECGISQFCAESRPFNEFCQEKWWDDFGFILKTAQELDMRVWLLDDKKFPTGYANGYLESPENAHLRKKLIRERQCDAVGPMKNAKFIVDGWLENSSERILRIIAYRHTGNKETLDYKTATDITDSYNDGTVTWDIPDGIWRICVMIETSIRPAYSTDIAPYYIDMLNSESCRAMINAIYEPHYEHFKEYFGNTFVGFFSDEPGFLNSKGSYHDTLGIMYEKYPWNKELISLIASNTGISEEEVFLTLPALWEDLGMASAMIRYHYMDVITKLYRDNFQYPIADWCHSHGVMYIGHIIEDMGAHMRLGYGAGHFFRALDGQDMAGMDIVLCQDIPGMSECIHRAPIANGGVSDPTFFRYTLPKMTSSHAHLQPSKQGRALCEIFGAYGWAEGLPFMKHLADIMLASGINHFVPHAFSPKYNDPDCPPHFYNKGKNLQYPLFKELIGYMNRCSHILQQGVHKADVAVFYNAEGEWTGGSNLTFHEICRELTQNLIDFDIIPYDYLLTATVRDNKLIINNESYNALIISESEVIPMGLLKCFYDLALQGLPIIFVNTIPKRSAEELPITYMLDRFECVLFKELAEHIREYSFCHVRGAGSGIRDIRFYHTFTKNEDIYCISNEAITHDADVCLSLENSGDYYVYEPWNNKCYSDKTENGQVRLKLEKGNLVFVVFCDDPLPECPPLPLETDRRRLELKFDISVKDEDSNEFVEFALNSSPMDITFQNGMSRFSGEIRYTASFSDIDEYTVLDLGEVGETAQVWLNGKYLGARINAPYKFSLGTALKEHNEITVLVKSNLAHRRRDKFSRFLQIPPTGIIGDIYLCKYEN